MNLPMNTSPVLPDDDEALGRVIHEHICLEESRLAGWFTRCWLASTYLQGVRRWEALDGNGRNFAGFSVDADGKIPLQVPELLMHVNKVTGLIGGMDFWPSVSRRGDSLGLIRDSACTQVLLDSVVNEEQLAQVKTQYALHSSLLGSCGINGLLVNVPTVGISAELEVVHPAELYPFPSIAGDLTKLRGILWVRRVPLDRLKKLFGTSKVNSKLQDMEVWRRRVAEMPTPNAASNSVASSPGPISAPRSIPVTKYSDSFMEAKVWELWVDGPVGTCARHVVGSGKAVLRDSNFEKEGELYYRALSMGRFWEDGSFHGCGLFGALFTLCRELEHGVRSVINNIRDLDRYPVTLIPAGVVNERVLSDKGHPLRFATIKPDPSLLGQGDMKPQVIQPFNAGETPGRTAVYMEGLIGKRVPVRDIIGEKGRVDSYQGLQYLEENAQTSSVVPVANAVRAFGEMYRGLARNLVSIMVRSRVTLPVKRLDLSLAGAVINFAEGTFSFSNTSPPDITRLSFSVKEVSPRSKSLRKQEATELLGFTMSNGQAVTTVNRYILLALKEGWDPALYMEAETAAVRMATFNLLALYGDGETPSEQPVWVVPEATRPDIQIEVVQGFMQTIQFHMASAEVADAIRDYYNQLLYNQGKMLPVGVPDPEESSLLNPLDEGTVTEDEDTQPSPSLNGAAA